MVNNDVLGHFFAVFGNLLIHLNLIRVIASNLVFSEWDILTVI